MTRKRLVRSLDGPDRQVDKLKETVGEPVPIVGANFVVAQGFRPRAMHELDGPAARYTVKSLPIDERPRERLLQSGPQSLSDGELLAIIVRTGVTGEMVTELANDLLDQFSGFWGLATASVEMLSKRRGLKGAKIAQIKAAIEIGRRMAMNAPEVRADVTRPEQAYRLLQFDMMALEQEELWLLLLDTKNHLIGRPRALYRGSLNHAPVRIAEIFRDAIRENAAGVILAHNHPSGDPTPSPQDIQLTREIVNAGKLLNVDVIDHIVIGRPSAGQAGFVSLQSRNLM